MSVIRVAMVWPKEPWRGGVNYYRNICRAVSQLPKAKVKIILFTGKDVNTYDLEDYVKVVHSPIFERKSIAWFFWKIGEKLNYDFFLYRLLKKHRINVISHHPDLWEGCPIISISWVPDFQFLRLPEMFRDEDIALRVKWLKRLCGKKKHVFLSSNDAKHDLEEFAGNGAGTSIHVLQFVSTLDSQNELPSKDELIDKYGLPEYWFHLPNQFWKHKNHKTVINALGEMKGMNKDVCIIATGSNVDFRNENHYQKLMQLVDDLGVAKRFVVLAEVPYKEVVSLMKHSIAVINPSLFEGWSTTVEEAKALGKKVVLSDIPVHREQNPRRGVYFSPKNAIELASILSDTIESYSTVSEKKELIKAQDMHAQSIMKFANSYESIIIDVTSKKEC